MLLFSPDDLKATLTTEHLGYSERTISKRQKNEYHKQVQVFGLNIYGIQCPFEDNSNEIRADLQPPRAK